MNELHFGYQVRQHLNRGLETIDEDKLKQLASARQRALSAQKHAAGAPVLAGAGFFFRFHTENLRPRHLLLVLVLILMTGLYASWQAETIVAELSDVDSALLADDVPVEALLDKGFESWLKDSHSH